MNDEVEGIILKQSEYKENDGLLTVFCKEEGKLTFVAKGILKDTSRNRGVCAPFSKSLFQIDYDPFKSMFPLKTGTVLSSHYKIRENLERLNAALVISEITNAITQPQDPMEELYEELDFCLDKLHEGRNAKLVVAYFISRVLKEMGLEPNVDECVICSELQVSTISIQEGGFVCSACAKELQTLQVDLASLKMFRYINKAEKENFDALEKALKLRLQDVKIFVDFLSLHSGIKLESWRFFVECIS